jgi:hypothetical protein
LIHGALLTVTYLLHSKIHLTLATFGTTANALANQAENTNEKENTMIASETSTTKDYARCVRSSKQVRWEIDEDVLRGRKLDPLHKYLPDALSRVHRLEFLSAAEQRLLSQIQGRTYANMFGLVERFINCKVLEISRDHWTGDQVALEALVRFSDEELKHQELFRRVDALAAEGMPQGYEFRPQPNEVAEAVLSKSSWSVLGLTYLIELFTQSHYVKSIEPENDLSPVWKDVFLFHWKEESQHAAIDELEWKREDAKLSADERDLAVDDLIDLVGAVDGLLQMQADADAEYFVTASGASLYEENRERLEHTLLAAYRWQYIVSGVSETRFPKVLMSLISPTQGERINTALQPLIEFVA